MPHYFAIGDIHGRDTLLDLAHQDIGERAQRLSGKKCLVHLGDYIDRGPQSRQVLERVMRGLPGFDSLNIRGNHDQMMLDFLSAPTPTMTRQWLTQGGWQTAASYGVKYSWLEKFRLTPKYEALTRAIPQAHLDWLQSLPLIRRRESDGFVFVHAGINPEQPLDAQKDQTLMWIREPFLGSRQDYGFRVVHGHTPSPKVDVTLNRINLDAGPKKLRFMMSDGDTLELFEVTGKGVKRVYQQSGLRGKQAIPVQ